MISKQIIEALKEEQKKLEVLIGKAKRGLDGAPEGSVLVKRYKKGVQFYYRESAGDRNGRYMPVSEKKRAVALIQKSYDKKIIAAASKQLSIIDSFLNKFDQSSLQEIFEKEGELRQKYLQPYMLPDDLYADVWQAMKYKGKQFSEDAPMHYTEKHERVRSKSEVMIANALQRADIPYRYECPLNLEGRIIYPDFTILRLHDRKELYWEHLGMMDDMEYRNQAFLRIRSYEANGIFPGDQLILTIETARMPLNAAVIQQTIAHYIENA